MTRIGLDLDNTIIDYEALIREEISASGLLDRFVAGDKRELRDAVRMTAGEAEWIRLQARIYGPRLSGATPFAGVGEFVRRARAAGVQLVIVSHKTRFAAADTERYDLRDAALKWLVEQGLVGPDAIAPGDVHFASTRAEKLAKIDELRPNAFLDDLIEVFSEPAFPAGVERWLFSPAPRSDGGCVDRAFASWDALARHVFGS